MTNESHDTFPLPTCPDREAWHTFVRDGNDGDEARFVHLEACANCQAVVDQLQEEQRLSLVRRSSPSNAGSPRTTLDFLRRLDERAPQPLHSLGDAPQIQGLTVEGVLGRGGMGIVYLVRQHSLERLAALKTIRMDRDNDADFLARFRREAQAIATLNHENVVRAYEFGEHAGVPYLLMEYVPGCTLHDFARQVDLTSRQAAELVIVLACAIDYAHGHGIVHRDLKPGNVLIATDGTPKITDFGLAKFERPQDGMQTTAGRVGTPCYMAPEQARGSKEVGTAADIYALGAILYELLCRRPPFVGDDVVEILSQVQSSDPIAPRTLHPRMSRDLETICLKCLSKAPADRYPSALALAEDLQAFLDSRPIVARPPGFVERGLKYARRHKLPVAIGVMSLVAVVGVVVAAVQQLRASRAEYAMQLANASSMGIQGQTLVSRGDWPAAIQALTNSLEMGHPHPGEVHLELARIHSIIANRDREALHVDEAARYLRDDGRVLLAKASSLSASDRPESQRLATSALGEQDDLSNADVYYAKALVAKSLNDAVANLRLAMSERPSDLRAGRMLCFVLILAGHFEEARDRATRLHDFYIDDHTLKLVDVLDRAAHGDASGAMTSLNMVKGQLSPQVFDSTVTTVQLLSEIPNIDWQDDATSPSDTVGTLNILTWLGRAAQVDGVDFFGAQLPPGLHDAYGRLLPSLLASVALGQFTGASTTGSVEQIVDVHRDGFTLYLLGLSNLTDGNHQAALVAFEAAADTPSFKDVRAPAHYLAARSAFQLWRFGELPEKEKAHVRNQMAMHAAYLLEHGERRPNRLYLLGSQLWQISEFDRARQAADIWRAVDAHDAGPDLLLAACDIDSGRPLSALEHAIAARDNPNGPSKTYVVPSSNWSAETEAVITRSLATLKEQGIQITLPLSIDSGVVTPTNFD